jgi:hypothetical protein
MWRVLPIVLLLPTLCSAAPATQPAAPPATVLYLKPDQITPDRVLKLREQTSKEQKPQGDRIFILPEGFQLKENVEFARDGDRVLAMDIMYPPPPLNSAKPPPILMEISCDNVNRMGSGSLLFCHDAILECAMADGRQGGHGGFAVAMVDHPVRPPYKGIDDPMPACIDRMKSAVKKLRALAPELGLSDKIGVIGFSRGAPFAAILAGQGDVNAALVHGNRFDYSDLLENDKMLPRFEKAWGNFRDNRDQWLSHGAVEYLSDKAAPMFLDTSDTESPEYRHGLEGFDKELTKRNIEHIYQVDQDGRGHRISTDPKTLAKMYEFFHQHLDP